MRNNIEKRLKDLLENNYYLPSRQIISLMVSITIEIK